MPVAKSWHVVPLAASALVETVCIEREAVVLCSSARAVQYYMDHKSHGLHQGRNATCIVAFQ